MSEDKTCKNLLCEETCKDCKNKEEDFIINECSSFPFSIPKMYTTILVENIVMDEQTIVFIKDDKIYIKAEDYKKDCIYLIHFQYPKCLISNNVIPQELTCERFEE